MERLEAKPRIMERSVWKQRAGSWSGVEQSVWKQCKVEDNGAERNRVFGSRVEQRITERSVSERLKAEQSG